MLTGGLISSRVNRGYLVNPPGIQSVSRATRHSSAEMCISVARNAKGNKVLLRIIAGVAAKLFVMDLQVRHRAARLTPPAVTTQDLLPESLVRRRVQPQARWFWASRVHDAFSLRPSRNACLCSPGTNAMLPKIYKGRFRTGRAGTGSRR